VCGWVVCGHLRVLVMLPHRAPRGGLPLLRRAAPAAALPACPERPPAVQ
jgi:hypothetical protein